MFSLRTWSEESEFCEIRDERRWIRFKFGEHRYSDCFRVEDEAAERMLESGQQFVYVSGPEDTSFMLWLGSHSDHS